MKPTTNGSEPDTLIESVSGKVGAREPQPELTTRQQQILDLMQDGKVNKEIANTLGIGVGTVKQHIVALFKKLNVRNRAMAVSRGMTMQHDQEERSAALAVTEGIMERRPCVVLSVALPEDASPQAVRFLHGVMAALAFDNDALFLARKGNAGDIIFGIQRVTEYDLIKALHAARSVFDDLSAHDHLLANDLRGGLTAGLAGASMNRFGGWTGEAVASAAIAISRDLVHDATPGKLELGQSARDMMQAFGIGNCRKIPNSFPFPELDVLHWTGERKIYGLIGRRAELAKLKAALANAGKARGQLIYLEGETGMGKSRLCHEASEFCTRQGGRVLFFRCLPVATSSDDLFNTIKGNAQSLDEVMALLNAPATQFPELVIIDDFHILAKEKQLALAATATEAGAKGRLVILSGRRRIEGSHTQIKSIYLRRLPTATIESLIREVLGKQAAKVRPSGVTSLALTAAGVPLFAVELARHYGDDVLALPLLVVICARLDNLRLDRKLLRCVARNDGCMTLEKASAGMGENVEILRQSVGLAVAVGVLAADAAGCLSFTHPLLRQIIDFLGME